MKFIPPLLGYKNFKLWEEYEDVYSNLSEQTIFEPNGLWIKVEVEGCDIDFCSHFITEKKLNEIVKKHRIGSIDSLENEKDIGKSVDKIFKWKVGDVVFFDFKLGYIQEMYDDKIKSINCGFGSTSSYELNDRVFEITPRLIKISDEYRFLWEYYVDIELQDYLLNTPKIHDILLDSWIDEVKTNTKKSEVIKFLEKLSKCVEEKNYDLMYGGEQIFTIKSHYWNK